MKRTLAILMAMLLSLPLLASCGTSEADTTAETSAPVETTPAETAPARLSDDLPETDMNGWEMRILSHSDHLSGEDTFYAYELTGEVVNDAIYNRDMATKERFNCTFSLTPGGGWAADVTMLTNSVQAGSRDYDLSFLLPFATGGSVIMNGVLYNMLEIDHINFEKPWWHTDMNNQYTLYGYLPFVSSDYLISSYQYSNGLIYNKPMAIDYGVEGLYDMVKEGTWTFDEFEKLITLFSQDSNGDGSFTADDTYGFASNMGYHAITWGYAAGGVSVSLDPEAATPVQLGWTNEKFFDTCMWLYDILYTSNLTFEIGWDLECDIKWDANRVFIQAIWLADLEKFRDCESDYGVLPYPKFDAAQDKYYTYVDARAGSLAIPIDADATTLNNVGMILEAQSCASHYDTLPVYTDSIQNSRYARDAETVEMIEYIGAGRRWDIGYSFTNDSNQYVWAIYRGLKSSGGQIVSTLEKAEAATTKRFEEIMEAYKAFSDMAW